MRDGIRFTRARDGVRVGFCVHGSGPALLFVRGWLSHLEGMWENPTFRSYIEALSEHFTVVRFDTRAQGVSDRAPCEVSVEAFALDAEAVVDALALDELVVYGQAFGGPTAIQYAAQNPNKVSKLILDGTYARGQQRSLTNDEWFRTIERLWPQSVALLTLPTLPDLDAPPEPTNVTLKWAERTLTPEMAGVFYRLGDCLDVTSLLSLLTMPALVMHRRRSRVFPLDQELQMVSGYELAGRLPDASFVALEGSAHNSWEGDARAALDAIGHFLGVDLALPDRGLGILTPMAILFTDIESSTQLTSELGDAEAQRLVRQHDAVVREALVLHGGTEVKHTGDGIMVAFRSISGALSAAIAMQRDLHLQEAPFRIKIGIDAGEPLPEGSDLAGTVVQSARRIVDRSRPGSIFVSDLVRRMVAGHNFSFTQRGRVSLKGLPERVQLFEPEWREHAPPPEEERVP